MKVIISNQGRSATFRLPATRRQIDGALANVGMMDTWLYQLNVNESNNINVTLQPEDDFDKALSQFSDGVSLSRIHALYDLLNNMSYNSRCEAEKKIVSGEADSFDKIYETVSEGIDKPTSVNFFFPLQVSVISKNRWGEIDDFEPAVYDGEFASQYREDIKQTFLSYTSYDDENMAEYYRNHNGVSSKLLNAYWGFEQRGSALYGKVTAQVSEPFTEDEETAFKDWIRGQNSDGIGEGFEQQDIEPEGRHSSAILNVHFWNPDDDYFIDNDEEFAERMNQDIGMGGI